MIGKKDINAEVIQTIERIIGTDLQSKGVKNQIYLIFISIFSHLRVIHSVYWSGSLILMYLSREMAHKLRIEAVEHITSELPKNIGRNPTRKSETVTTGSFTDNFIYQMANLIQILHAFSLRGHSPVISFMIAKGITNRATY